MKTITRVSKAMQAVLVKNANKLAVETGFMERERVLTGSSFITGLVFGWQASPDSSLAGLSQAIGNAGTPISRQWLERRFDERSVGFAKAVLEASLEQAVKAMPVSEGILSRFESVELVDSSIIILPNNLESIWKGCGGYGDDARVASLKLNVRLDVRSGELHLECLHSLIWGWAKSAYSPYFEV
jgi:hypothetical protein